MGGSSAQDGDYTHEGDRASRFRQMSVRDAVTGTQTSPCCVDTATAPSPTVTAVTTGDS